MCAAEPVDREHPEREEDPPLQLRDAADVLEAAGQARISTASARGLRSSILRRARSPRCTFTVEVPRRVALGEELHRRAAPRMSPRLREHRRRRPSRPRRTRPSAPTFDDLGTRLRPRGRKPRFGRRRTSGIWPPSKHGGVCGRPSACPGPSCRGRRSCRCRSRCPRPTPLRAVARAGARRESLEHRLRPPPRTRCATFAIMPRTAGVSLSVDDLVQAAQAEPAQRRALALGRSRSGSSPSVTLTCSCGRLLAASRLAAEACAPAAALRIAQRRERRDASRAPRCADCSCRGSW